MWSTRRAISGAGLYDNPADKGANANDQSKQTQDYGCEPNLGQAHDRSVEEFAD